MKHGGIFIVPLGDKARPLLRLQGCVVQGRNAQMTLAETTKDVPLSEYREPTPEEIEAMDPMEGMEYARSSHLQWAEYLEAGGDVEATFTFDAARERALVRLYDRTIAALSQRLEPA